MPEMTTLTARVPADLISTAKDYNINISQACRDGITRAIEREQKIRELGL